MSYIKIDDPSKRDKIVQDYIARKDRLKKEFKRERAQKLNIAEVQERFFEPVTTSQALTTDALKQLDKNLEAFTQNQLLLSPQAAIEAPTLINLDVLMKDALAGAEEGSYNMRWDGKKHIIGTKPIYFNNGKVIFDETEYPATKGLLQLLTRKNPMDYDEDDLENYGNILDKSGAIYQSKNMPRDKKSVKWENIVRPIWARLYPQKAKTADYKKARRQTGKGAIFLPSDPNALFERLQLLLSSVQAGNTGIVQNEIVAILDEFLRTGHINREEYKNILLRV